MILKEKGDGALLASLPPSFSTAFFTSACFWHWEDASLEPSVAKRLKVSKEVEGWPKKDGKEIFG